MGALQIGVKGPNFGPDSERLLDIAVRADHAGFDSLWFTDRLATPSTTGVPYPYTRDGAVPWKPTDPFYEVVVAMSMAAARTSRIRLASGVLVLPLRDPLVLAKQVASLDVLSGERVVLGVGAGWLQEEFAALDVPYHSRGARADETIQLLRACWEGSPAPFQGEHHRLPDGLHLYPAPRRRVPVLVGGMSPAALRRAGRLADGWYGLTTVADLDVDRVAAMIARVRQAAAEHRRPARDLRIVLRVAGPPADVARAVPSLRAAGVHEVVVDVDWNEPGAAERSLGVLRDAGDRA